MAYYSWKVVAKNSGPDTATGVEVANIIPVGSTYFSAVLSKGSYDADTDTWLVGTLESGEEAEMLLTVQADPDLELTNTSEISGSVLDLDLSNNIDTATISNSAVSQVIECTDDLVFAFPYNIDNACLCGNLNIGGDSGCVNGDFSIWELVEGSENNCTVTINPNTGNYSVVVTDHELTWSFQYQIKCVDPLDVTTIKGTFGPGVVSGFGLGVGVGGGGLAELIVNAGPTNNPTDNTSGEETLDLTSPANILHFWSGSKTISSSIVATGNATVDINLAISTDPNNLLEAVADGAFASADAADHVYDNSGSGLIATNVQAAIDEIVAGSGLVYWIESQDNTLGFNTLWGINSVETNINAVIQPKGSGAFYLGPAQDNTATGGASRGTYATDLQHYRSNSTQVASGEAATIGGGSSNTASAAFATVPGGVGAVAYLHAQEAYASGIFQNDGDAQSSKLVAFAEIIGTGAAELFLDGSSLRLAVPSTKVWGASVDAVVTVQTVGAGTLVKQDSAFYSKKVVIKNVGGATSIIGAVQDVIPEQAQASLSDGAFNITADDTNDSLKLEYTPPSTAAVDSVFRVVATITLTEVGVS